MSEKEFDTWYALNRGDGIMAGLPSAEIEEKFQQPFMKSGKRPDMAIFTRAESEGRLHCEVMAYFSPAAGEVTKAFDAQPCVKPARAGLGLLAGDERSWSVLFPDTDG